MGTPKAKATKEENKFDFMDIKKVMYQVRDHLNSAPDRLFHQVTGIPRPTIGPLLAMLPCVTLSAADTVASSLKNTTLLYPRVLQATRSFYTGKPSLALILPSLQYKVKVYHGLITEDVFSVSLS